VRQLVGDQVDVRSAGTHPGMRLNNLSMSTLLEVGIDIRNRGTPAVRSRDASASRPWVPLDVICLHQLEPRATLADPEPKAHGQPGNHEGRAGFET
jgi:protein-tyrosine-phosphatase